MIKAKYYHYSAQTVASILPPKRLTKAEYYSHFNCFHPLYNLRYVTMTIKVQEACKNFSLSTSKSTRKEAKANGLYKIRKRQETLVGTTTIYLLTILRWFQDHHVESLCSLNTGDNTIKLGPQHLLVFLVNCDGWIGSQVGCGQIGSSLTRTSEYEIATDEGVKWRGGLINEGD